GNLAQVRASVDEYSTEYSRLTDETHKDELARAQQQVRLEQLEQRAIDELGLDPTQLVAEFGPHLPVPSFGERAADGDTPESEEAGEPYVREVQEKRLRNAERSMA